MNLTWDYPEVGEIREPDAEAVLKEINGYDVATGEPVSGLRRAQGGRQTASGCWIYAGCYADGVNQTRRRDPGDLDSQGGWVSPEWAWAWPANRRMLYNRASADPEGRPWSERKKYVWWDEEQGKWTGYDVPDFPRRQAARLPARARRARAWTRSAATDPFIMMADGKGWLYSPAGLLDGPMPTHYEPLESPVANLLYPEVGGNPAALTWNRPDNPRPRRGRPALPVRRDDVPAHRAPHRGRDEPLACPGWPSCSRRCSPRSTRSSPPSAASRTAAGW